MLSVGSATVIVVFVLFFNRNSLAGVSIASTYCLMNSGLSILMFSRMLDVAISYTSFALFPDSPPDNIIRILYIIINERDTSPMILLVNCLLRDFQRHAPYHGSHDSFSFISFMISISCSAWDIFLSTNMRYCSRGSPLNAPRTRSVSGSMTVCCPLTCSFSLST